jgi:hypothetical protein
MHTLSEHIRVPQRRLAAAAEADEEEVLLTT